MSVDQLRDELKRLGYLTHGVERWFALDPLSSRAFWSELLLLAAKSAALLCVFVAAPYVAVMLLRNEPLGVPESVLLAAIYSAAAFVVVLAVVLLAALLFKLRPLLGVESPRALTVIGIVLAAAVASLQAFWWLGFGDPPAVLELIAGAGFAIVAFALSARVFFAALLSFSIHETRMIPTARRSSPALPLTVGAVGVLALLMVPAYLGGRPVAPPAAVSVPVKPSSARVAFLAVDGLTHEIFSARGDLKSLLPVSEAADPLPHKSAPEVWATIGTGTAPSLHSVRSVEGVRLLGARRILQSVSSRDFALRDLAPALRLATREPLPPLARERAYVWEIVAGRGVPSLAVNWWTSPASEGNLMSVPQSSIFTRTAHANPQQSAVAIDSEVSQQLRASRQFVAAYFPALDIVLNRLHLDSASQLASSVVALENLSRTIAELRRGGYEVVMAGIPGEGQSGKAVIASTLLAENSMGLLDLAPTLLDLLGFPASEEMAGRSALSGPAQARITSYGAPSGEGEATVVSEEYYESLRALGYIQ